jgi:hypothetical protein
MSIRFTLEELPEGLGSKKEKEKYIQKEIKKAVKEFNLNGKSSTELEYRIGSMFIVLKKVVKKDGDEWETYREDKFPYLNKRTVQRYMRLANKYDLHTYPMLSFAGQTRLLDLLSIVPKKESIADFLNDNGIGINREPKHPNEVTNFKNKIDDLIKSKKEENKKPRPPSVSASLNRIKDTTKKYDEVYKLAKEDNDLLKPVSLSELKQTIELVENLLKQLKRHRKQVAGKSSEPEEEE